MNYFIHYNSYVDACVVVCVVGRCLLGFLAFSYKLKCKMGYNYIESIENEDELQDWLTGLLTDVLMIGKNASKVDFHS